MKRPTRSTSGPSGGPPAASCKLSERLSSLWEWLSDPSWEDGESRQTGTLMLMVEDGLVKVWVHDRETGTSAWVSSESLQGALELVNKGLREESLEWRMDKRKEVKKR